MAHEPLAGLQQLCSWGGTFLATTLTAREDELLVGDALRSAILLRVSADGTALTEIAREHSAHGIMALESLSASHFIAADQDLNLFTMTKSETQSGLRKDVSLQPAAMFHLGEVVTKFQHGKPYTATGNRS